MNALILMTRVPIPGKTKTRLMELLSGQQCAEIHRCFLLDLFHILHPLNEKIDLFLTYTPEKSIDLLKNIISDPFVYFPQEGDDLGFRMENAIGKLLKQGYKKVILIGSDIPDLQPDEIMEAFDLLDEHDVCLGPTLDGGYYLIGMKKLYNQLFNNHLKWGNKSVLEGTMDIANQYGLTVGLAKKHRDIDTKEDLQAFINEWETKSNHHKIIPKHTIQFIQKCWSDEKYAKRYNKG